MSTKENWDDESSDDEGGNPPEPPTEKGGNPPEPPNKKGDEVEQQLKEKMIYDEVTFVEDEGYPPEEYDPEEGGYPPEEYDTEEGGEGGYPPEEEYDSDYDDFDKKLGRYVTLR